MLYVPVCSVLSDSAFSMDCSLPRSSAHWFFRQEYWCGLSFTPLDDLPDPGIKLTSPVSPDLAGGFFNPYATMWVGSKVMGECWTEKGEQMLPALLGICHQPSVNIGWEYCINYHSGIHRANFKNQPPADTLQCSSLLQPQKFSFQFSQNTPSPPLLWKELPGLFISSSLWHSLTSCSCSLSPPSVNCQRWRPISTFDDSPSSSPQPSSRLKLRPGSFLAS